MKVIKFELVVVFVLLIRVVFSQYKKYATVLSVRFPAYDPSESSTVIFTGIVVSERFALASGVVPPNEILNGAVVSFICTEIYCASVVAFPITVVTVML